MSDNKAGTSEDTLTINDIIDNVVNDSLFAGNPNLLSHVEWYEEGLRHKLIRTRPSKDHQAIEACLRTVGKVSPTACYTSPEGAWSPNSTFSSDFSKSRARADIIDSGYSDQTKEMWKQSLAMINKIIATFKVQTNVANKPVDLKQNSLRVRHTVFQLFKTHAEFEAEQQRLDSEVDEHMRMEQWKCKNKECQSMLVQLMRDNDNNVETRTEFYIGKPIPVFERNGQPVPPPYDKRLIGAIVEIAFALSHDTFGNKKDNFYAEIAYITILQDPPGPATKRAYETPPHLLAKKKPRIA